MNLIFGITSEKIFEKHFTLSFEAASTLNLENVLFTHNLCVPEKVDPSLGLLPKLNASQMLTLKPFSCMVSNVIFNFRINFRAQFGFKLI